MDFFVALVPKVVKDVLSKPAPAPPQARPVRRGIRPVGPQSGDEGLSSDVDPVAAALVRATEVPPTVAHVTPPQSSRSRPLMISPQSSLDDPTQDQKPKLSPQTSLDKTAVDGRNSIEKHVHIGGTAVANDIPQTHISHVEVNRPPSRNMSSPIPIPNLAQTQIPQTLISHVDVNRPPSRNMSSPIPIPNLTPTQNTSQASPSPTRNRSPVSIPVLHAAGSSETLYRSPQLSPHVSRRDGATSRESIRSTTPSSRPGSSKGSHQEARTRDIVDPGGYRYDREGGRGVSPRTATPSPSGKDKADIYLFNLARRKSDDELDPPKQMVGGRLTRFEHLIHPPTYDQVLSSPEYTPQMRSPKQSSPVRSREGSTGQVPPHHRGVEPQQVRQSLEELQSQGVPITITHTHSYTHTRTDAPRVELYMQERTTGGSPEVATDDEADKENKVEAAPCNAESPSAAASTSDNVEQVKPSTSPTKGILKHTMVTTDYKPAVPSPLTIDSTPPTRRRNGHTEEVVAPTKEPPPSANTGRITNKYDDGTPGSPKTDRARNRERSKQLRNTNRSRSSDYSTDSQTDGSRTATPNPPLPPANVDETCSTIDSITGPVCSPSTIERSSDAVAHSEATSKGTYPDQPRARRQRPTSETTPKAETSTPYIISGTHTQPLCPKPADVKYMTGDLGNETVPVEESRPESTVTEASLETERPESTFTESSQVTERPESTVTEISQMAESVDITSQAESDTGTLSSSGRILNKVIAGSTPGRGETGRKQLTDAERAARKADRESSKLRKEKELIQKQADEATDALRKQSEAALAAAREKEAVLVAALREKERDVQYASDQQRHAEAQLAELELQREQELAWKAAKEREARLNTAKKAHDDERQAAMTRLNALTPTENYLKPDQASTHESAPTSSKQIPSPIHVKKFEETSHSQADQFAQISPKAVLKPAVTQAPASDKTFEASTDDLYKSLVFFSGMSALIGDAKRHELYVSKLAEKRGLNAEALDEKDGRKWDVMKRKNLSKATSSEAIDLQTDLKGLQSMLENLPNFGDHAEVADRDATRGITGRTDDKLGHTQMRIIGRSPTPCTMSRSMSESQRRPHGAQSPSPSRRSRSAHIHMTRVRGQHYMDTGISDHEMCKEICFPSRPATRPKSPPSRKASPLPGRMYNNVSPLPLANSGRLYNNVSPHPGQAQSPRDPNRRPVQVQTAPQSHSSRSARPTPASPHPWRRSRSANPVMHTTIAVHPGRGSASSSRAPSAARSISAVTPHRVTTSVQDAGRGRARSKSPPIYKMKTPDICITSDDEEVTAELLAVEMKANGGQRHGAQVKTDQLSVEAAVVQPPAVQSTSSSRKNVKPDATLTKQPTPFMQAEVVATGHGKYLNTNVKEKIEQLHNRLIVDAAEKEVEKNTEREEAASRLATRLQSTSPQPRARPGSRSDSRVQNASPQPYVRDREKSPSPPPPENTSPRLYRRGIGNTIPRPFKSGSEMKTEYQTLPTGASVGLFDPYNMGRQCGNQGGMGFSGGQFGEGMGGPPAIPMAGQGPLSSYTSVPNLSQAQQYPPWTSLKNQGRQNTPARQTFGGSMSNIMDIGRSQAQPIDPPWKTPPPPQPRGIYNVKHVQGGPGVFNPAEAVGSHAAAKERERAQTEAQAKALARAQAEAKALPKMEVPDRRCSMDDLTLPFRLKPLLNKGEEGPWWERSKERVTEAEQLAREAHFLKLYDKEKEGRPVSTDIPDSAVSSLAPFLKSNKTLAADLDRRIAPPSTTVASPDKKPVSKRAQPPGQPTPFSQALAKGVAPVPVKIPDDLATLRSKLAPINPPPEPELEETSDVESYSSAAMSAAPSPTPMVNGKSNEISSTNEYVSPLYKKPQKPYHTVKPSSKADVARKTPSPMPEKTATKPQISTKQPQSGNKGKKESKKPAENKATVTTGKKAVDRVIDSRQSNTTISTTAESVGPKSTKNGVDGKALSLATFMKAKAPQVRKAKEFTVFSKRASPPSRTGTALGMAGEIRKGSLQDMTLPCQPSYTATEKENRESAWQDASKRRAMEAYQVATNPDRIKLERETEYFFSEYDSDAMSLPHVVSNRLQSPIPPPKPAISPCIRAVSPKPFRPVSPNVNIVEQKLKKGCPSPVKQITKPKAYTPRQHAQTTVIPTMLPYTDM